MHRTRFALLAVPAVLLLSACESTSPRTMQRVSLSTVIGAPGARPSPSGPAADVIVSGSGGSVRITSAQIVLADVRLEGGGTCGGMEADVQDGHDSADVGDSAEVHDSAAEHDSAEARDSSEAPDTNEHDCEALNVGPVTVNLPLDGTTKVALDALVPAGTYTGLRAELAHVDVAGVFTDSTGADHPFSFTSGVGAEVEMTFPAPVTVGAGTNNLTIDVNVGSWFTDAGGAVIDPTNPQNHEAIEHAIRASFRAFEDDNHDGNDDHEEDGGH
jgi:hypothetical protein